MKTMLLSLALVVALGSAAQAQILENVGTIAYNQTPGSTLDGSAKWGVTDVGWLITSPDTFSATSIGTQFGLPTGRNPGNPNRSIVAEIFTGVPAQGGQLLASATINPVADQMSFGTLDNPIVLTAGTTYFIGFENIGTFGPNTTDDPNADDRGMLYVDYSNENTFYTAIAGSTKPVFEVDGTPLATPEPSSWALALMVAGAFGLLRRRSQRAQRLVASPRSFPIRGSTWLGTNGLAVGLGLLTLTRPSLQRYLVPKLHLGTRNGGPDNSLSGCGSALARTHRRSPKMFESPR